MKSPLYLLEIKVCNSRYDEFVSANNPKARPVEYIYTIRSDCKEGFLKGCLMRKSKKIQREEDVDKR